VSTLPGEPLEPCNVPFPTSVGCAGIARQAPDDRVWLDPRAESRSHQSTLVRCRARHSRQDSVKIRFATLSAASLCIGGVT
jgi:hypothetical protein